MALYYCKTTEQLLQQIEQGEIVQGSNLYDNTNEYPMIADIEAKLLSSQAELESYLVGRFPIVAIRNSGNEYLVYCHAVICWWYLQINGETRDLIRSKYEDVIKRLREMTSIMSVDGVINVLPGGVINPDNPTKIYGRPRVGKRSL